MLHIYTKCLGNIFDRIQRIFHTKRNTYRFLVFAHCLPMLYICTKILKKYLQRFKSYMYRAYTVSRFKITKNHNSILYWRSYGFRFLHHLMMFCIFSLFVKIPSAIQMLLRGHLLYSPQTVLVKNILFSRCPSIRPSVRNAHGFRSIN